MDLIIQVCVVVIGVFCLLTEVSSTPVDSQFDSGLLLSNESHHHVPPVVIQRIVGGRFAKQNEFPYQVVFRERSSVTGFCGGSIIDDNWILTAGHCFKNVREDQLGDKEIVFGAVNLKTGYGATAPIHSVILHKKHRLYGYNMTLKGFYDIALVYTKVNLMKKYSSWRSEAVKLPKSFDLKVNDMLIITGFGVQDARGGVIVNLKVSQIPVQPDDLCEKLWKQKRHLPEIEFCAGDLKGVTDTCSGDSGGPVTVKTEQGFVQVGIVSVSRGCANIDEPGVYVRVSAFHDWIEMVKSRKHTYGVNKIYDLE